MYCSDKSLKTVKSRELRGGILYTDCHCLRRNGLQNDCRRGECQGLPPCSELPYARCEPARVACEKHCANPNSTHLCSVCPPELRRKQKGSRDINKKNVEYQDTSDHNFAGNNIIYLQPVLCKPACMKKNKTGPNERDKSECLRKCQKNTENHESKKHCIYPKSCNADCFEKQVVSDETLPPISMANCSLRSKKDTKVPEESNIMFGQKCKTAKVERRPAPKYLDIENGCPWKDPRICEILSFVDDFD